MKKAAYNLSEVRQLTLKSGRKSMAVEPPLPSKVAIQCPLSTHFSRSTARRLRGLLDTWKADILIGATASSARDPLRTFARSGGVAVAERLQWVGTRRSASGARRTATRSPPVTAGTTAHDQPDMPSPSCLRPFVIPSEDIFKAHAE